MLVPIEIVIVIAEAKLVQTHFVIKTFTRLYPLVQLIQCKKRWTYLRKKSFFPWAVCPGTDDQSLDWSLDLPLDRLLTGLLTSLLHSVLLFCCNSDIICTHSRVKMVSCMHTFHQINICFTSKPNFVYIKILIVFL